MRTVEGDPGTKFALVTSRPSPGFAMTRFSVPQKIKTQKRYTADHAARKPQRL